MAMSDQLRDSFNEQIALEFSAAYTYLAMAAYFDEQNLTGFSSWMIAQHEEELEHARKFFDFIRAHPDIFSGFFHVDLQGNVLPKLELLRQLGFYPLAEGETLPDPESCGAHSLRGGLCAWFLSTYSCVDSMTAL